MADAIRQIRHDLELLAKANDVLAKEFDIAYGNYLKTMSASMQRQVVLACYHLCTHTYPDQFLKLSFRQREKLQQSFQEHIHQVQQQLVNSYVLATTFLGNEEDEQEDNKPFRTRRRSLPPSDRSLQRQRNDDDDGPSIEFIAIGDMDEDDAIAMTKDPFLTSALSEFADSLALDEESIIKRVKQELFRKAAQAAAKSADDDNGSSDNDSDNDAIDGESGDGESGDGESGDGEPGDGEPGDDIAESEMDNGDVLVSEPHNILPKKEMDEEGKASVVNARTIDHRSLESSDTDGSDNDESTLALSNDVENRVEAPSDDVSGKTFSSCQTALTPKELASRQEQVEKNLVVLLRDLSKKINKSFHGAGILPQKLPLAVLNAALKADVSADTVGGAPNILSLLVEAEGKSRDSKVMRVTAIRLRPPELEFTDPQLSACRSRIRELMAKLQKIGKEYDKKQRERAIAEAESAWRSSWYERHDNP